MTRISILDPTAPPPDAVADPGPPLATHGVEGSRFGIRFDLTWRSFDWVRDEWRQLLEKEGAEVADWCAGDRTGEAAEATLEALRDFVSSREVLVSGLGN